MVALLLDIYILVVWLIFFRFKLLKFDLKAKIGSAVVGVLFVFGILIVVNFLHPQTFDAAVVQKIVPVAPRIAQAGRVVEVAVEPNVPVKAGAVLFRVDPRPFQLEIDRLTAAVSQAEQNVPQLKAAWEAARQTVSRSEAQVRLAATELKRQTELREKQVNTAEELEVSRRNDELARASLAESESMAEKARLAYESKTLEGENVEVAQLKAQLAAARVNLEDATVRAPLDGFVTNLELQPGYVVTPGQAVLTFVPDPDGVVVATFPQEYLRNVAPGDAAEVALDLYPGRMLKGKVDAIVWASGTGQLTPSGVLPTVTQGQARARFGVKIRIDDEDRRAYRLPAGAGGSAAIYTRHGRSWQFVRKVMIRWYTWLNYIKISM